MESSSSFTSLLSNWLAEDRAASEFVCMAIATAGSIVGIVKAALLAISVQCVDCLCGSTAKFVTFSLVLLVLQIVRGLTG